MSKSRALVVLHCISILALPTAAFHVQPLLNRVHHPQFNTIVLAASSNPTKAAATTDAVSSASSLSSFFPAWPENVTAGKRDLETVIAAFEELTTTVPLKASSEEGDGWREWIDGGYSAQRFILQKLSRQTYLPVLALHMRMMVAVQAAYPDLYAVVKFVPKKNGLNPLLAELFKGDDGDPDSLRIEHLRPREVRRRLDDLQRALEQSWLLISAYLTLPGRPERDDLMWSARTVVEKVKTDQRSRALELLCLGFFHRDAALYPLVAVRDAETGERTPWTLKAGFEKNFGIDTWHPKPTNARMIWQRSRMVYPFLEVAHRVWLNYTDMPLGSSEPEDCNILYGDDDEDDDEDYFAEMREAVGGSMGGEGADADDIDFVPQCGADADEENAAAVGELLDRIARASPEEKVLNSLLYWLIDTAYKTMAEGVEVKPWDPQPYLLRLEGVEARLVEEMMKMGHLLQLLYQSEAYFLSRGAELLLQVKEIETTTTLLHSIQSTCAESCPEVLERYDRLLRSESLTLRRLEQLEFDALGALLETDGAVVQARADTVRKALSEWRNPELLFRYLDANRHDENMYNLIKRWLRAIFGLSDETLRMIRRESEENVRHLLVLPQDTLLRWYSEECPGTSRCKTLFMLGEDAGSCLRIISNDGNKYNRALMGYVLQSHVRALVVTDAVGRVMVRSLIRLVVRSDTLTPVIFCDPMFFTIGYSRELQRELLAQARQLEAHMQIPVVHAGSVLPELDEVALDLEEVLDGGYVRRVQALDYDVTFVDLLEIDGVAPYTYSEELPYDDLLGQHVAGVQKRTDEGRALVIAALPRADSPSAARYAAEREGETAWTMHIDEAGEADYTGPTLLPEEVGKRIGQREHVGVQVQGKASNKFDPNARAWDEDNADLPANYKAPSLDE